MAGTIINVRYFSASFLLLFIFSLLLLSSHAVDDTIRPTESLRENQTLVSAGGMFELGFFSDGLSSNRYLGIWFKDDETVKAVWVSRENPLLDPRGSGVLQMRSDGNLIIIDRRQTPLIVNAGALATRANATATLLDSGNLVLRQGDNTIVWQSFDYPTDTYLPGMKLGWFGLKTGSPKMQFLVSWVSPQSPARGLFTLGVDNSTSTSLSVWRGDSAHMDVGFWDQQQKFFRFIFEKSSSDNYNFTYVSNENETYFLFNGGSKSSSNGTTNGFMWLVMASTGQLEEYMLLDGKISSVNHSLCDDSSREERCVTSIPSKCKDRDNFTEINGATLPNPAINVGFSDCQIMCRSNCSCAAFASLQNTGCQLYFGNKDDVFLAVKKGAGIVYVRGESTAGSDAGNKRRNWLIIAGSLASLLFLFVLALIRFLKWRKHRSPEGKRARSRESSENPEVGLFQIGTSAAYVYEARNGPEIYGQKDQELPLFSFYSIEMATDGFADANKLGEGGFGPVYKGRLGQGQEIAVKRLSKISRQGMEEFKNEVCLISKLQHRNLVRLLGCCIEADESILVYEYMLNKSLDSFIFDYSRRGLLDWKKRVNIVEGIAQGLLYLHKYSRLRIIHRDLKTSNILLDNDLNPKISDFGMARIFGDNESRIKTNRVVGTFGYMSPEYAMDGLFSEKSDVFSFGVIVLEIISGNKNIAFFETDHSINLIGKAWTMWKEGKSMELLDTTLLSACSCTSEAEASRYVQLGLLCVQERAIDRPTMSEVVSMLSNGAISLPHPKEPAFLSQIHSGDASSTSSRQRQHSINGVTASPIYRPIWVFDFVHVFMGFLGKANFGLQQRGLTCRGRNEAQALDHRWNAMIFQRPIPVS